MFRIEDYQVSNHKHHVFACVGCVLGFAIGVLFLIAKKATIAFMISVAVCLHPCPVKSPNRQLVLRLAPVSLEMGAKKRVTDKASPEESPASAKRVNQERHDDFDAKAQLSGMLGVIKNRADGKGEVAEAAKDALKTYETLNAEQKKEFVVKYWAEGGAKGNKTASSAGTSSRRWSTVRRSRMM